MVLAAPAEEPPTYTAAPTKKKELADLTRRLDKQRAEVIKKERELADVQAKLADQVKQVRLFCRGRALDFPLRP